MRHGLESLMALSVLMALQAPAAQAQCDFNTTFATKQKVSLIRDFAACPSSQHASFTTTGFTNPTMACTPVVGNDLDKCAMSDEVCDVDSDCFPTLCGPLAANPNQDCFTNSDCGGDVGDVCVAAPGNTCTPTGLVTTFKFGPKGACTVSAKSKVEKDCSQVTDGVGSSLGLPTGECHVTYVSSKCKDIRHADDSPVDGAPDNGFNLTMRVRMTFDDATNNDLSLLEFPVTLYYSNPDNGSMSINSSSAEVLAPLVGADNAALPPCTQISVIDLEMRDPADRPFASIGTGTHP